MKKEIWFWAFVFTYGIGAGIIKMQLNSSDQLDGKPHIKTAVACSWPVSIPFLYIHAAINTNE